MTDSRAPVFAAVRDGLGRGLKGPEVVAGDAWLDSIGFPRAPAADPGEPRWIGIARALIGQREIPGAKHNAWIAGLWKRLRAPWFSGDETPWCGAFVAHCMDAAGLPFPKDFARAASWASYGTACAPALGAIGVKKRAGGNHVFFIVGETADKRYFKALGGNQGNAVSIVDIAKSDTFAVRWPAGERPLAAPLPRLAAGTVSAREA
jgi:uncharacterized protein (TIGR02594 family)